MAARIIDGKAVAASVRGRVADDVKTFEAERGRTPHLVTVIVGDDPASEVYVAGKHRACKEVGMRSSHHGLPAETTEAELLALVRQAAAGWVEDDASSMGAALAYYTLFSITPMLVIVIALAGAVFGEQAARGEVMSQLSGLVGADSALTDATLVEWMALANVTAIALFVQPDVDVDETVALLRKLLARRDLAEIAIQKQGFRLALRSKGCA